MAESAWQSPALLLQKPDGSNKIVVDYRSLNSVTRLEHTLPTVSKTVDALRGNTWFTTLSIAGGAASVPLSRESREKTAFKMEGQPQMMFNVMPGGLIIEPGTMQHLVGSLLPTNNPPILYIDRVVLAAKTSEECMKTMEKVFERARKSNVKFATGESSLMQRELRLVGHVFSERGLAMDPAAVEALARCPAPTSRRELQRFLARATFYAQFVQDFADLAAPLHRLLRKGVAFAWPEDAEHAFVALRAALAEAPVLASPTAGTEGTFILDCRASDSAVGSTLYQQQREAGDSLRLTDRVLEHRSRALDSPCCCPTLRDLLALSEALDHFQGHLAGRLFRLRANRAAVQWVRDLSPSCARRKHASLQMQLKGVQFTLENRAGRHSRVCEPYCLHGAKPAAVTSALAGGERKKKTL